MGTWFATQNVNFSKNTVNFYFLIQSKLLNVPYFAIPIFPPVNQSTIFQSSSNIHQDMEWICHINIRYVSLPCGRKMLYEFYNHWNIIQFSVNWCQYSSLGIWIDPINLWDWGMHSPLVDSHSKAFMFTQSHSECVQNSLRVCMCT